MDERNCMERISELLDGGIGAQCISSSYYPRKNYKIDFAQMCRLASGLPQLLSPETMPVEAKSFVYTDASKIRAAVYKDGRRVEDTYIMPDITDVSVANDRVVFVTFADGTKEKAVLAADDEFSLEQGISICVTKKLLSMQTEDNGGSVYNKIIEKGLKVIKDKQKKAEAAKLDEQKKRAKINKLKAKKVRKANAAREAQIEMQKEAYLRAMREFNGTSTNAPCFDVAEQ